MAGSLIKDLPVELLVNGKSASKKQGTDHVFMFDIQNEGHSELMAIAGNCKDTLEINKVDKPNDAYI